MYKNSYVYILSNFTNRVLYIGVTSDLVKRVFQHKNGLTPGFTSKYHVDKLVYYETCEDIRSAIEREKKLKGGSRKKKVDFVNLVNPEWKDLYPTLF